MAKIPNGILGRISGKVSNVVGFVWKGIPSIRSYVIPANPNTAGQQTQRGKFGLCQMLASIFLATITQVFWNPFTRRQSGFNRFIGVNVQRVANPTDYPQVLMANGKLEQVITLSTVYDAITGNITFTYSNDIIANGLANDFVVYTVFDSANEVGFVNDGGNVRNGSPKTWSVGAGRIAADLECWIHAYRGLGTPDFIVSPSTHVQAV